MFSQTAAEFVVKFRSELDDLSPEDQQWVVAAISEGRGDWSTSNRTEHPSVADRVRRFLRNLEPGSPPDDRDLALLAAVIVAEDEAEDGLLINVSFKARRVTQTLKNFDLKLQNVTQAFTGLHTRKCVTFEKVATVRISLKRCINSRKQA